MDACLYFAVSITCTFSFQALINPFVYQFSMLYASFRYKELQAGAGKILYLCLIFNLLVLGMLLFFFFVFVLTTPFSMHYSTIPCTELRLQNKTNKIKGKSPALSSPCKCHYSGSLIDGTEFDSSYKRGEPLTLAPNQVIK